MSDIRKHACASTNNTRVSLSTVTLVLQLFGVGKTAQTCQELGGEDGGRSDLEGQVTREEATTRKESLRKKNP
jgi:hypothetical protein